MITIVFIISLILNYCDWQFSGYLTEKIIAWTWITWTLIFIITFWKNKKTKIYLMSLIGIIILSIIPMGIPFIGMINFLTTNEDDQQLKINEEYRIERTRHQPLSIPRVYFYQKHFNILEKNICRPVYSDIIKKTLKLQYGDSLFSIDEVNIPIQNAVIKYDGKDSIGVEYQIRNRKSVIYHRKNNNDGY